MRLYMHFGLYTITMRNSAYTGPYKANDIAKKLQNPITIERFPTLGLRAADVLFAR